MNKDSGGKEYHREYSRRKCRGLDPVAARALPSQPLVEIIRSRAQLHEKGVTGICRDISAKTGFTARTIERILEQLTVTSEMADRVSIALKLHPAIVWGSEFYEGVE